MERKEEILHYWFGHAEGAILPSEHRTHVWFASDPQLDNEIKEKFFDDYHKAMQDHYIDWENDPHGMLALIIIFDQFTRRFFRRDSQAFQQDHKALALCLRGIEQQFDHKLSLLERVFFYFPLMHSEDIEMQSLSLRAYQMLMNLSFPETRPLFEKFLQYAVQHYEIINRFGRFPNRNEIIGRPSLQTELDFLKTAQISFDF